jgi:hypothetical protein
LIVVVSCWLSWSLVDCRGLLLIVVVSCWLSWSLVDVCTLAVDVRAPKDSLAVRCRVYSVISALTFSQMSGPLLPVVYPYSDAKWLPFVSGSTKLAGPRSASLTLCTLAPPHQTQTLLTSQMPLIPHRPKTISNIRTLLTKLSAY